MRTKSTVGVLLMLGEFPPPLGVNDTPFSVVTNASKFVLEGGVSGVARIVTNTVAFPPPPPPQFTVHGVFNPLQELIIKIVVNAIRSRDFFAFIHLPQDSI